MRISNRLNCCIFDGLKLISKDGLVIVISGGRPYGKRPGGDIRE